MYILRLHCHDRAGIVAAVATALSECGCNIEESSQFNDPLSGRFFMRVVYAPLAEGAEVRFAGQFEPIAAKFSMNWQIDDQAEPVRTLILVSKEDHCLNDLLYRWRTNHLSIHITGVAANHGTHRKLAEDHGLPFHHLPVTAATKSAQEGQIAALVESTRSELIVLARYMQIITDHFCESFPVINIHHSFLPAFIGGKPYHRAHARGVKLIGATAHYATADLDEGPIIEQDIARISHRDEVDDLLRRGRLLEKNVLVHAVKAHIEDRVIVYNNKCVVFDG